MNLCRCGRGLVVRPDEPWRRRTEYMCPHCEQARRNCYCDAVVPAGNVGRDGACYIANERRAE